MQVVAFAQPLQRAAIGKDQELAHAGLARIAFGGVADGPYRLDVHALAQQPAHEPGRQLRRGFGYEHFSSGVGA